MIFKFGLMRLAKKVVPWIVAIIGVVVLWIWFWEILAIFQISVISIIVISVIFLLLIRRRFLLRWLVGLTIFMTAGFSIGHFQMASEVKPFYQELLDTSWCVPHEVIYNQKVLNQRDRVVQKNGFIRLPWTDWILYCNQSALYNNYDWDVEGSAVYLWIPPLASWLESQSD